MNRFLRVGDHFRLLPITGYDGYLFRDEVSKPVWETGQSYRQSPGHAPPDEVSNAIWMVTKVVTVGDVHGSGISGHDSYAGGPKVTAEAVVDGITHKLTFMQAGDYTGVRRPGTIELVERMA